MTFPVCSPSMEKAPAPCPGECMLNKRCKIPRYARTFSLSNHRKFPSNAPLCPGRGVRGFTLTGALQTPLSTDKLHCHIFYQALLFSMTASSDILLHHVCGVLLVPTITRNNLFWYSTHSGLRQHSYFIIGNYVMGANDPLTATIHLPSS